MKTKVKKLPTFIKDTFKRVSIREYLRHYKSYNEDVNNTNKDIIITNQDEDIVRITPVHPKKKPTFADLDRWGTES